MNRVQFWALSESLTDEDKRVDQREESRLRYFLAGVNPDLYKSLFPDSSDDDDIEWKTPQSGEELDELMEILGSAQRGSETPLSEP